MYDSSTANIRTVQGEPREFSIAMDLYQSLALSPVCLLKLWMS